MVRTPTYDRNGLKKGAWSQEEDDKLRAHVLKNGHSNWRELPKFAGLARCGKSCRLRWMNYLRPDVKRGNYTKEEEDHIIKLHDELGKKWSKIAATLPGRTDNEIKNHWHTHLKKRSKQPVQGENDQPRKKLELRIPQSNPADTFDAIASQIVESSLLSPLLSSTANYSSLSSKTNSNDINDDNSPRTNTWSLEEAETAAVASNDGRDMEESVSMSEIFAQLDTESPMTGNNYPYEYDGFQLDYMPKQDEELFSRYLSPFDDENVGIFYDMLHELPGN
ncbi:hypothetical protein Nepgr_013907 [Nepenthes gracilis]|uniref:Uncharacterized protein n=1 Tax=Nepenthes gracilis TaxID=150966 RepID=A0AAD3SK01_NEPGR|nr:hypothetical protein Nepgr_013907 [Nepenthes gracilis]